MKLDYRFTGMEDLDYLVRMRIKDLQMFANCPVTQELKDSIRRFYTSRMQDGACFTLVGYDGGEIVATGTIYYYDVLPSNENPRGRVGQITNVWVDEGYRRQGIATEIVGMLLEKARHEVGMVCLNSSDAALAMYKAMGFTENNRYLILSAGQMEGL